MRHLLLLLAMTTLACDKTVVTPNGTAVIDYKATGKLTVSSWTLGAPQGDPVRVDKRYRYDPGDWERR